MRAPTALLLLVACAGPPGDAAPPLVLVAQNAGTTRFMDGVDLSELREPCETWYDNNLCTLDTEVAVREALVARAPALAFLQEMWHAPRCDAPDRPDEVQRAPFACAAEGAQLDRILPSSMDWACASAYPDNCIAWDRARFTPDAPALTDLSFACSGEGRIATLSGALDGRPATLAVVHTNAGPFASDADCRAEQLDRLTEVLEGRPEEEVLLALGDFNHDPETSTLADGDATRALLARTGMRRLPDDGLTSRLVPWDLDLALVRGVLEGGACAIDRVDDALRPRMLDHGMLTCR